MLVFFFTDVKAGGKVQFVVFQWEVCNVAMFCLSPLICMFVDWQDWKNSALSECWNKVI